MGAFAVRLIVKSENGKPVHQPFIRYRQLQNYQTQLSSTNWYLLNFIFHFRYIGPVAAGLGVFTIIMIILHTIWITQKEMRQLAFALAKRKVSYPKCFEKIVKKWQFVEMPPSRGRRCRIREETNPRACAKQWTKQQGWQRIKQQIYLKDAPFYIIEIHFEISNSERHLVNLPIFLPSTP